MQGLKILIVDDDFGDRKLFRRLLSESDLAPLLLEAETTEAAEAFHDQALDAIFLDYHLPMVSGLSVLSSFRKTWPSAAIFLMTGQGDEDIAKSAIQEGASDYLSKSQIEATRLIRLLKNGIRAARMRRRLEEQYDDLSTFSEVLVHDFRAPIRATAFLTEQIEEDLNSGQIEQARKGLSVLNASALQMREMLRSLSDHIRFDRDDAFEAARPWEMLEQAILTQDSDISEASALIHKLVSIDLPTVRCQPQQIIQVLQNLIANALKYAGDRPPDITIEVKLDDCGMMVFEVRDQGIGIPEEFLERVFEPFKRVPGRSDIKGTGLGLATCKKVVQRHGGRIWCTSEHDQGTTMRFTLPVYEEVKKDPRSNRRIEPALSHA